MEKAFKELLKTLKTNEAAISQALGALVVVIVGVLLFNYFKTAQPQPEISEEGKQTVAVNENVELTTNDEGKYIPKNLPTTHTVGKGEDLWKISEKYYGNGYNWVDIASENNIANANVVSEGMELTIPQAALRWDKEVQKTETAPIVNNEPATKGGESMLEATSYTVQKGDHLWKVALQAYGDGYKWADIYNANKETISDPNYIEIGMELSIPR